MPLPTFDATPEGEVLLDLIDTDVLPRLARALSLPVSALTPANAEGGAGGFDRNDTERDAAVARALQVVVGVDEARELHAELLDAIADAEGVTLHRLGVDDEPDREPDLDAAAAEAWRRAPSVSRELDRRADLATDEDVRGVARGTFS